MVPVPTYSHRAHSEKKHINAIAYAGVDNTTNTHGHIVNERLQCVVNIPHLSQCKKKFNEVCTPLLLKDVKPVQKVKIMLETNFFFLIYHFQTF